jgi:predicted RNase H-like HicB family nuclease
MGDKKKPEVREILRNGADDAMPDRVRWKMRTSAKTTVSIPIQIKKEPKYFLFYCPVLDLWSMGKTKDEAERNLKEDLRLLLTRCSKYKALDQVLSDCGFTTVEIRA